MSTLSFDTEALAADLGKLDEVRGLAFGVLLLERAKSGFFSFQVETGWPGGGIIRAALAECWSTLERCRPLGASNILLEDFDRITPDSEIHASRYTSAAIDAANIAYSISSYLSSPDVSLLIQAAELRRDTVDLFVQGMLADGVSDLEREIQEHPLMQMELKCIYSDLRFLRTCEDSAILQGTLARVIERSCGHEGSSCS